MACSPNPHTWTRGAIPSPIERTPTLSDKIVPKEAYEPFLARNTIEDTKVIEFPTGHVGLSVEPEAHAGGWPKVCEWLEARS